MTFLGAPLAKPALQAHPEGVDSGHKCRPAKGRFLVVAEAIRVFGAVHESYFEHCLLQGTVVAEATQRLVTTLHIIALIWPLLFNQDYQGEKGTIPGQVIKHHLKEISFYPSQRSFK